MTGATTILDLAGAAGSAVCFANPGTTEMGLVQALEARPGMRAVLCLFEGVCTGAADGYARVADVPALTLLHLGPGFANGMANLHNARRAGTGIVNLVGDHPAQHLAFDSPLVSDIIGMAHTVSDWVRTTTSATVASDAAEAFATAGRGLVATLVVPSDVQFDPAGADVAGGVTAPRQEGPPVDVAADALRRPGALLLLGGRALRRDALHLAHRIQVRTGCRVLTHTFTARYERGRGIPSFPALPYFPEAAAAALADTEAIVTVGAGEPIGNFHVEGIPGRLTPEQARRIDLSSGDPEAVLAALVDALGAPAAVVPDPKACAYNATDPITAPSIGAVLAAEMEEDTVVVEEGATNGWGYVRAAPSAPPHLSLGLTGGAIGIGLPLAVGASAATGTRVVALQADGSAMYTNQALWTMARESQDVTILLLANERYAILQTEMRRAGTEQLGPTARSLTELCEPSLDWQAMARSMGVPSARCGTNAELAAAVHGSLREPGPMLIQVDLPA